MNIFPYLVTTYNSEIVEERNIWWLDKSGVVAYSNDCPCLGSNQGFSELTDTSDLLQARKDFSPLEYTHLDGGLKAVDSESFTEVPSLVSMQNIIHDGHIPIGGFSF